jgi:membrane protease YdiL (CAAX protease family)
VTIAFLAFLALYVILITSGHFRDPTRAANLGMRTAMTALTVLALVYAFRSDVFTRQLISPVYIAIGLIVGHLIFVVSLSVTQRSLSGAASHVIGIGPIWSFAIESPAVLTRFVWGAFAEELIYRAAAQPMLIGVTRSPVIGIALTAALFVVIHREVIRGSVTVTIEFVAFSVLLGVLYYWTGSFVLVLVIHAVRNVESTYIDYLMKVEELGDEAQAAEAIDQEFQRRPVQGT